MRIQLPLTACLSVTLAAAASGCGSSEKASTNAAGTSVPTTVSAQASAPQTKRPQGTSTKLSTSVASSRALRAFEQKVLREAKAKPKHQAPTEPVHAAVHEQPTEPRHHFPAEVQSNFIAACTAAKGSASSCECIVSKAELSNVEKGQSIAELLAIEVVFRTGATLEQVTLHRVHSPEIARRYEVACGGARKA